MLHISGVWVLGGRGVRVLHVSGVRRVLGIR